MVEVAVPEDAQGLEGVDEFDDLDAQATLALTERVHGERRRAEAARLALAVRWADLHHGEHLRFREGARAGAPCSVLLGGEGTPEVDEFAPAEFGLVQDLHPLSARALVADALDLRFRLPCLWGLVQALEVESWVARKVAVRTRELDRARAGYVDAALAEYAATLSPGQVLDLCEAKIIEADPDAAEARRKATEAEMFVATGRSNEHGVKSLVARARCGDVVWFTAMCDRIAGILAERGDPAPRQVLRARAVGVLARPAQALALLAGAEGADAPAPEVAEAIRAIEPARLRPPVTLYLHLDQGMLTREDGGVVRFEQAGPLTLQQAVELVGHGNVTIKPVLDVGQPRAAGRYEFDGGLREAMLLRRPGDIFPHATSTSRGMDIDHTTAHAAGGATSLDNGGPMTRHHHRIKTHGGWRVSQRHPGRYTWRSPHGHYRVVDPRGTHRVPAEIGAALQEGTAPEAGFAELIRRCAPD